MVKDKNSKTSKTYVFDGSQNSKNSDVRSIFEIQKIANFLSLKLLREI